MAARWLDNVGAGLKYLGEGFLQILYPKTCWVCGETFAGDSVTLCQDCQQKLTRDPMPHCPRCANTVGPYVDLSEGCTRCRDRTFVFERAFRLGPYGGLLRETILKLKNWSDETLAEIVGEVWAECGGGALAEARPDVIVPVPLHWRREWQRGFNQSDVLARALANKLRIPNLSRCLRRVRATPRQVSLTSPSERLENVKGAFQARAGFDLKGKSVLLVDDVLTTGATLNEAAKAIRALKPARIFVAVLAAAEPP